MTDFEMAKKIYKEIITAIQLIEKTHDIYCAIPMFIEFNGIIYQHYQCFDEKDLMIWGARGGQQMSDIAQGKVKFYYQEKEND